MKLENIILRYGLAVLDLPETNDPIGKPIDEAKQQIKDLFIDIANETLDAPEDFIREVEQL